MPSSVDRQALGVKVATIISTLPFPAMPVSALVGQDNADATASSHDLFASMIGVHMLRCQHDPDAVDHHRQTEDKIAILHALYADIQEAFSKDERRAPDSEILYLAFQTRFRQYLALYPGSPDVRFASMHSVAKGDTVHSQTADHVAALQEHFMLPDYAIPKHMLRSLSYSALILQLASTIADVFVS